MRGKASEALLIYLFESDAKSIEIYTWASGGYSNLGARGKNFQKLMLSEKKRGLILACIFFSKTHGVL